MTELAQRTSSDGESTAPAEQLDDDQSAQGAGPERHDRPSRRITAGQAQKGSVWVLAAGLTVLVIALIVMLSPGETGSRADWFFGSAVFALGLVTVWQTQSIHRRAAHDAAEAADRLRAELAAAEMRSARQLALLRSLHETEREAQRELARADLEAHRNVARAELEAQRELARVERAHLLAQQQRLATTEVSRAVHAQTLALAMLWDEGARVLGMADRAAREQAMRPVFERIGRAVRDFSVEFAHAKSLTADNRLHDVLLDVNEAVLAAMRVAEDVHVTVVDGDTPDAGAVQSAQRVLHDRAAEARHLAWQLLRTGLADSREP